MDPTYEGAFFECSAVSELADELSSFSGCRGEALALYMKYLYDLRQLYVDSKGTVMSKEVFEQHYCLYLNKAQAFARVTEPHGVPEKLIYSKMMGLAMVASDAEANGSFEEARNYYSESARFMGKLYRDARSDTDKATLRHSLQLIHNRIAAVTPQK